MKIAEVKELLNEGKAEEALRIMEQEAPYSDIESLFLLGEVYYKNQKWGKALNAFQDVIEIEKEHKGAQTYVTMIQNIIGFVNLEMLNP